MKMKKFLVFLLVAVLAMTTLIGCTPQEEESDPEVDQETDEPATDESKKEVELLVSAAASLTDVLEDIKTAYKENSPEITLTYTLSGSGALQAQIEEGAPVDVFISAAQKQMDALEEGDYLLNDTRETLLLNKVVLISSKDSELDIKAFEDMTKDEVKKIGVGDPASVPVGQYNEEIFNNLEIKDQVNDKLVLAPDVRTVLNWVEIDEVDLGLVYMTDAMTSDKVNIIAEAPEESHQDVSYPAAVIKDSEHPEEAQAFLDFLSTDEVKKIFEEYGFTIN